MQFIKYCLLIILALPFSICAQIIAPMDNGEKVIIDLPADYARPKIKKENELDAKDIIFFAKGQQEVPSTIAYFFPMWSDSTKDCTGEVNNCLITFAKRLTTSMGGDFDTLKREFIRVDGHSWYRVELPKPPFAFETVLFYETGKRSLMIEITTKVYKADMKQRIKENRDITDEIIKSVTIK